MPATARARWRRSGGDGHPSPTDAGQPGANCPRLALSLNNLSNLLSDAATAQVRWGDPRGGGHLSPTGAGQPGKLCPDFAQSLNNCQTWPDDAGDGAGSLAAIRERQTPIADWRRATRRALPPISRRASNNLSNRLSDAGDGAGALAAIRQATDTYRRLAQDNPARFAPALERSLRVWKLSKRVE